MDEKQSALIKGVCEEGHALLQLVNDVLDFSKIEAGKLELAIAPFHLRALLLGLKDLYGKQAQAKALRFELLVLPIFRKWCKPMHQDYNRYCRTCSPMPSSLLTAVLSG